LFSPPWGEEKARSPFPFGFWRRVAAPDGKPLLPTSPRYTNSAWCVGESAESGLLFRLCGI
jgi:hypothetical protein